MSLKVGDKVKVVGGYTDFVGTIGFVIDKGIDPDELIGWITVKFGRAQATFRPIDLDLVLAHEEL